MNGNRLVASTSRWSARTSASVHGGPAAVRPLADLGPERAVVEVLAAGAAEVALHAGLPQVEQLADVAVPHELAEHEVEQRRAAARHAGYVQDRLTGSMTPPRHGSRRRHQPPLAGRELRTPLLVEPQRQHAASSAGSGCPRWCGWLPGRTPPSARKSRSSGPSPGAVQRGDAGPAAWRGLGDEVLVADPRAAARRSGAAAAIAALTVIQRRDTVRDRPARHVAPVASRRREPSSPTSTPPRAGHARRAPQRGRRPAARRSANASDGRLDESTTTSAPDVSAMARYSAARRPV